MSSKRTIPFKISHLDSLGQGVSKESDKITFIPKTMTGDEGEAVVLSEKKGVAFARVNAFSKKSQLRIEPKCPHFEECPSCHYLHINYQDELKIKKGNLQRLFQKLPVPEIEVISAPHRTNYRNRIQLHYDLNEKKIGMFDIGKNEIIPIPSCKIALAPVEFELQKLYQNGQWMKDAPQFPKKGHVEIYYKENDLKVSWNRPYAEGGFTQVFEEMNQKLKDKIIQWYQSKSPSETLDLFSGAGNLTQNLNYSKRLCVDIYEKTPSEDFISINLYEKDSLFRVKSELKKRNMSVNTLILDPPRSGHKDLNLWLSEFKPQFVTYVSCDPHTMVRDLSSISSYDFKELLLFDFFPSTFHFETLMFLERKS